MSKSNESVKLIILYIVMLFIYQLILIFLKEKITFDVVFYSIALIIVILPLFPHIDEIKIGFFGIKKKLDVFKQDFDDRLLLLQNTIITSVIQKQELTIIEAVPQLLLALKTLLLFGFKALFALPFLPILDCWTASIVNKGSSERDFVDKKLDENEILRRMKSE